MADCPIEIELTGWNNQDAVRGGMTALPNAAAAAAGGLITAGTGTNQISLSSGGVDLQTIKTQAVTAAAGVTFPSSIASPTNITAGTITTVTTLTNLPAITTDWLTSAGVSAGAVTKIQSGLATPTNITAATGIVLASGTHTGAVIPTVTNLTNAPTSGDFTATMKTSIGTAVAASAVASVTGNVGGNVVGSVGSVVAAIVLPNIPAGWITAAGIGTDAIDADAIATDAISEIQSGLSTLTAAGVRTAIGLATANLDAQIATLATPTNITAATGIVLASGTHTGAVIPTVTNLTNAPTAGDFTATMKTSIGTAVAGSAVASVTGNVGGNVVGSVGSVTGNVGGNVVGSVGSLATAVIKKNTALANFEFMMTDSSAHAPSTGKTVTCTRSIDGSSFAAGALANVAEVAFGIYRVDFGAGDLNGNVITLRASASGCDDTFITLTTTP